MLVAVVLVLVLVTASCRSDTSADAVMSERQQQIRTADALPGVDVWTGVGQSRHLEGSRRITVPVRFDAEEPVLVSTIAMRVPHFEPLPPEPKDSLVHPGLTVDLQVDVGAPRCGPLVDDPPEVHLTVTAEGGRPADLALPVPTSLLDDLRERACTLEAIATAVDVRFGDFRAPDGIALAAHLVVERRDSIEPIVVQRMTGSVLLSLEPPHDAMPVAELAPEDDRAEIPVEVTATRCDPHGLAGSQKTFVFSVWVAVGDAPPVYLELRPGPDLETAMRSTLAACIAAGG